MSRSWAILILILILIIAFPGCSFFSGDAEVVYAPTEVGTPVGDKVTKEIGVQGGTLLSPDGRLTLTVPPNAVTENTTFSIQPISNKAEDGLGTAYRIEPTGKAFDPPLQLSIRYGEEEVNAGHFEKLAIAYQDEKGAWHVPNSAKYDAPKLKPSGFAALFAVKLCFTEPLPNLSRLRRRLCTSEDQRHSRE